QPATDFHNGGACVAVSDFPLITGRRECHDSSPSEECRLLWRNSCIGCRGGEFMMRGSRVLLMPRLRTSPRRVASPPFVSKGAIRAGRVFVLALIFLLPMPALAGGGLFGMDHRVNYDDSGIWGEAHQNQVLAATGLFVVGAALWEGNDSRFGHTMWQSSDAMVLALAGHFVLANVFQRRRPRDTSDPDQWFEGFGNRSFPSRHVMLVSAAVTPVVLEYGSDHPWVW